MQESFLEMINSLLTSGMIPALFDASEKDALIQAVQSQIERSDMAPTKETSWQYFITRCRDNLHIVMITSPVRSSSKIHIFTYSFRSVIACALGVGIFQP